MARRRDFIRDIDNTKDTLKLVVRIIDLWFVETKDKFEQAEMIIMDENVVLFNFLMLIDIVWCYNNLFSDYYLWTMIFVLAG